LRGVQPYGGGAPTYQSPQLNGGAYAAPAPPQAVAVAYPQPDYRTPVHSPYQPNQLGPLLPPLATWGQRFAASLLDLLGVILLLGVWFAIALFFPHTATLGNAGATYQTPNWGLIIPLACVSVLGVGVVQLNSQGLTGASLGKYIVGIRLIALDTMRPIGFWACLGRQLCHGLDSFSLGIGYLAPLWTQKRQTLADMAMNTIVIQGQVTALYDLDLDLED
jgi:uncharacterized RDD family membrane protein YckC